MRGRLGITHLGSDALIPIKDNLPSARVPMLTIAFVVVTIAIWASGADPDLSRVPWPLAGVASTFIAGGFGELAVDMLFLWIFAESLEDVLGRPRLLLLYLMAGVAAAAGQQLADPGVVPSAGAAGAVAGVIGAYTLLFGRARVLCFVGIPFFFTFVEIPALIAAAAWFVLQAIPAVGQPPLAALAAGLALGIVAARPLIAGRPAGGLGSAQPV